MEEVTSTTLHTYSTTTTTTPHIHRDVSLVVGVVACFLAVMGVTGNVITIASLLRDRRLRKQATTSFVVSLAVSDFLFCSVNLPLTATRYLQQAWTLGDTLCKIFPFFFYGNVAASLMNMVAITINRYILVGHHHIYKRVYTQPYITLMITSVWLFSFGMLVPPLFSVWGTMDLDQITFSCTIKKKDGKSPKKFLFVVAFLLPTLAIVICYSAIFIKVRANQLRMKKHRIQNTPGMMPKSHAASRAHRRENLKLTKTMLTIFLLFLICFLPLMIVNVLEDTLSKLSNLHVIASMLAWTSATLNPVVYFFLHQEYKTAFMSLLSRSNSNKFHPTATPVTSSKASFPSSQERRVRPVQLQCLHSLGTVARGLQPPSNHKCLHEEIFTPPPLHRDRTASFSIMGE